MGLEGKTRLPQYVKHTEERKLKIQCRLLFNYMPKAAFPRLVYLANICHSRITAMLWEWCTWTNTEHLPFSHRLSVWRKSEESRVFTCEGETSCTFPKITWYSTKRNGDVYGQRVSCGISGGQVHESWERDRNDQATVHENKCLPYVPAIEIRWKSFAFFFA